MVERIRNISAWHTEGMRPSRDTASEFPIGKLAEPEIIRKVLNFSSGLSYPKHKLMERTEFIKTPITAL